MDYYSLLEIAQIKAISAAIEPSAESIYRIKCREYSELFHTPLHMVYELDPAQVLLELYENTYPPSIVQEELPELLEKLRKIKDPTYNRMSATETEDLVDMVIQKELNRLGKRKKEEDVTLPGKNTSEKEDKEVKPKKGGVAFGDLEQAETEAELPNGGFKE